MSQSSNERGGTERWVGFIILLCLAGIAAGVFHKQFSFNPAVLVATTAAPEAAKTSFCAGRQAKRRQPCRRNLRR